MTIALAGAFAAPAGLAFAEDSSVYNLGELHVTAPAVQAPSNPGPGVGARTAPTAGLPFEPASPPPIGGDTVTAKKIESFEKATLDKAAELTPGVIAENLAGPRNEQNIYVHGFDRWQVPIYLDGVRLYLPADNRLDFGRFLTSNLAEIQISKGYDSVLNGPGGMGGSINLVTTKPVKPIEGEIGSALDFGGRGQYLGERTYARVGTKQDLYYLQLGGAWNVERGFILPESYTRTANQGSGLMNHSATRDDNVNFKAGYTPNATDEYSVNFLRQEGEKGVPYSTTFPIASQRDWSWPFWNTQTLALHTHTLIDPTFYVDSKLYWNRMDNSIVSYSNVAQTLQNTGSAFDSEYHDWSLGASLEAGKEVTSWDILKAALHYRRDTHNENEGYFTNSSGTTAGCTANVVCYSEPRVTSYEDTYSVALENTAHLANRVDLVQGVSYDWRNTPQAQGFNSSTLPWGIIHYPDSHATAPNGQAAVIWHYDDTDKVYLDFSDRTRFPTLFERYSTKFGLAIANPGLTPERAANLQLGWEGFVQPRLKLSTAVYGSIVNDMIESVGITIPGKGATTQSQNVGLGHIVGADFKADYAFRNDLAFGGQLSLIHRWVNLSKATSPNLELIGTPGVIGMVYAKWSPLPNFTITPNLTFASDRWSPNYNSTAYVQTGAYMLVNFKAEYKVSDNLTVYAGGRNLTDRLYVLTDGYPEPGRSFYIGARATF